MKKFLALAAMMVIGTAHAEELKFGDMNYFLKQGQFNVGADFLANNEVSRVDKGDESEVDAYLLNTHYSYALSDSLNFTLGVNFLIDGETEASRVIIGTNGKPKVSTDASADAQGVQNPSVGANYRFLNQNTSGYNVDFGAVATFKLTDREAASTNNKDGNIINPTFSNYFDPRTTLEVNARVGKKWDEANEFYLVAGALYHTDGEYEQLESGDVEMDSSVDFKLGGVYQYRPVHEFMMGFGLTAIRFGEMDGDTFGSEFTRNDYIDYQFSFTAKYLINESLIAKFLFTHDRRDEVTYEYAAGDSKVDKRNGGQYGLGIDYLF